MQQITLQVNGMSCAHCVNSVEKALKEIGASGEVDLQGNTVTVNYDESRLSLDAIQKTLFQFPEVDAIEILSGGKQTDSLMGHVELSHPIKRK
jgi:copper chaperone